SCRAKRGRNSIPRLVGSGGLGSILPAVLSLVRRNQREVQLPNPERGCPQGEMGGIAGCDRCAVKSSPGKQQEDEQKDIASRVHRCRKAWRETVTPLDLRDFLPRAGETAATSCLLALIKTDMEMRAEIGLEVSLGYYLTNFLDPARITVPAQLIY